MKIRIKIIILFTGLLVLCSCSGKINKNPYRIGENGLIYNTRNNELYNGKVVDTTDVIIEFEVKNGIKDGRFATYYLNGTLEKTGLIKNNLNQGEWKYYYDNGVLESSGSYLNDRPQGIWTFYYPNGGKKEEGTFRNGNRDGEWKMYTEEGKLNKVLLFSNGNLLNGEHDSI